MGTLPGLGEPLLDGGCLCHAIVLWTSICTILLSHAIIDMFFFGCQMFVICSTISCLSVTFGSMVLPPALAWQQGWLPLTALYNVLICACFSFLELGGYFMLLSYLSGIFGSSQNHYQSLLSFGDCCMFLYPGSVND